MPGTLVLYGRRQLRAKLVLAFLGLLERTGMLFGFRVGRLNRLMRELKLLLQLQTVLFRPLFRRFGGLFPLRGRLELLLQLLPFFLRLAGILLHRAQLRLKLSVAPALLGQLALQFLNPGRGLSDFLVTFLQTGFGSASLVLKLFLIAF
ncbi:hypothetical protein D1872_215940 [compost metagenome]